MGRFFVILAWTILLLLLVDSAMNDPDVQPVVDRQVERAEEAIRSFAGWIPLSHIVVGSASAHSVEAASNAQTRPSHGPAARWYPSTMLIVALALVWLAKSERDGAFRNQVECRPTPQLLGCRS